MNNFNYRILQLKKGNEVIDRELLFMTYNRVSRAGREVSLENYSAVYEGTVACSEALPILLENLYRVFNLEHPNDYRSRSVSVSDIIQLKQEGATDYESYYVDGFGFRLLPQGTLI